MEQFFNFIFWGNTIRNWAISIGIIAGCMLLARLLKSVVLSRIGKAAEKTKTSLDDFAVSVMQRIITPFLYILAVYYGLRYLTLNIKIEQIFHAVFLVVSVYFIIRMLSDLISYSFQRYMDKGTGNDSQIRQARGILLIFKIILWIFGGIFLIDNFGYDITTIITGLGIGGIAIALAAQAILGDLFSYLVIFFDKPFEIGDFIIIGDKMGSVEYIGIKTTRLRALGGEQLIISNTDLTNSRVQNYKRMERRRVILSLGVVYETSPDKLKKIPAIVKKIIESQPDVQFDRAHFSGFGDFNLNFEIIYYILSADYNKYMDTQQAINLEIFEAFDNHNIEFAYPTKKIFLQSLAGESET
ncbi:MAG TPA: mechanosensitive ion channel family protein, partial [Chitinophagaceae bacterium]|nr:mechanosensitive ion channel family protein [Chitinophagaceae bacterium]